jgi:hypothetical protein
MAPIPNHNERQLMQQLRDRGWVKGLALPPAPRIVGGLLEKGWIEERGVGKDLEYRITADGIAAKKAPVRLYR